MSSVVSPASASESAAVAPPSPQEGIGGDVPNDIIYDLRDDEQSALTSGTTILSSIPDSGDGNNIILPIPSSLSSLSLNPSSVDSSLLANGNWIGLHEASSMSSDSLSSASSQSTPCFPPSLFANIGRSLVLASASSPPADANSGENNDCDTPSSKSSGVEPSRRGQENKRRGVKWWDQLQTDEDWDNFRARANDYLNALVADEMKDRKKFNQHGYEYNVDKMSAIKTTTQQESAQEDNRGLFKVRGWLQGLFEALTATTADISSQHNSKKTEYFSSLVKEAAEIQQQLDRMPSIPPTLPEELPLDDLPKESRELLVQHRTCLDACRGEAMQQREALSAKYSQCQEKLLAAIIDAEEEVFYSHEGKSKNQGWGEGSDNDINNDGYIEIAEKNSPFWDDVNEAVMNPQSKCQLTLRAALFAALTAGAGFFITLQSKRR